MQFDFPALLKHLTGRDRWKEIAGPSSRCGQNHWFERGEENREGVYINVDRSGLTIEISHASGGAERIYSGSVTDEKVKSFVTKD